MDPVVLIFFVSAFVVFVFGRDECRQVSWLAGYQFSRGWRTQQRRP
jgi:hypothetical protein